MPEVKMGEPFETATCSGCQRLIRHVYWGNGGTLWEHFDGRGACAPISRARSTAGTVEPFPAKASEQEDTGEVAADA